jgi:hypothetical protein
MTTDKSKRVSKINTWKPKDYQVIVEKDGKLFVCHFDRLFGHSNKLSTYNRFLIGKESYINQLDIITSYINFFINNYDCDNELVTGYLKCKFAIDKNHQFGEEEMNSYIDFLYEVLFTETMVSKIVQLVEENYLDDIETSDEDKKKYVKNEKKHLESLEFTNQHIKILLEISFGMKIMAPCLFHYIQMNHIKIEKDSDIIFRFYQRLFKLFGYANTWEICNSSGEVLQEGISEEDAKKMIDDKWLEPTIIGNDKHYYFTNDDGELCYLTRTQINVYNKLYVYVKAKVLESNANNAPIFAQREIFGIDVFSVVNMFTKKVLISENMVKYKFNEHWDEKQKKYKENIVGFNKTIIKFQISYFLKEQYSKTITEVTNTKNSEGLSGSDKMLMNQNKLDEGSVIMSDLNIELTIKRIQRRIDVPISNDEIEYYLQNHHPSKLQIQLVYAYYTKYFGTYRDLNLLTRKQYIILLLLLKKKLLIDLGYEEDEAGKIHYACLPYILTGNLSDKVNTRIIRNNKFIAKIEESYMYQDLIHNKYNLLECIKPDAILSLLSQIINTRFTYVTYEYQELTGTEISYNEDKISDELLFFLSCL